MNLGVTAAVEKDYMWLTVGVRLLANRLSSTFSWQCLCQLLWGNNFLRDTKLSFLKGMMYIKAYNC